MPFSGGWTPSPERYGAGEGKSDVPLLQRVYESLAAQRGTAYDQGLGLTSPQAMETVAYARAITSYGYGANRRLANQFFPTGATADGLLSRWERIFGLNPLPTDTEVRRRLRLALAWALLVSGNAVQAIHDALATALGPLFVSIVTQTPVTANVHQFSAPDFTQNPVWGGFYSSTICHIDIQLTRPLSYSLALFFATVGQINSILDELLPAWMTWSVYVLSSHGTACFYLDEPNLDLEVFCT